MHMCTRCDIPCCLEIVFLFSPLECKLHNVTEFPVPKIVAGLPSVFAVYVPI